MSSTTYPTGDDPTTREMPRVAPYVRPVGRATVRPLHSVRNDQPVLPEPRRRDDTRHTGNPTVLWASLAAAAAFAVAVAGGLALFLQADEMDERVRVVGWVVVLCAFLITLTSAAVAVLVHDRRKDKAGLHDEFYAFVEQATVASVARYQQILDGQDEIREAIASLTVPSITGRAIAGRIAQIEESVAVLPGVAAWAMSIERRLAEGQPAPQVMGGDGSVMELSDAEMRAYFMGFYDRERDRDAESDR